MLLGPLQHEAGVERRRDEEVQVVFGESAVAAVVEVDEPPDRVLAQGNAHDRADAQLLDALRRPEALVGLGVVGEHGHPVLARAEEDGPAERPRLHGHREVEAVGHQGPIRVSPLHREDAGPVGPQVLHDRLLDRLDHLARLALLEEPPADPVEGEEATLARRLWPGLAGIARRLLQGYRSYGSAPPSTSALAACSRSALASLASPRRSRTSASTRRASASPALSFAPRKAVTARSQDCCAPARSPRSISSFPRSTEVAAASAWSARP